MSSEKNSKLNILSEKISQLPETPIIGDEENNWYFRLIQMVHLIGSAFVAPHFWKSKETTSDTFKQLIQSLNELETLPQNDHNISIFNSGENERPTNGKNVKYNIKFSSLVLDKKKIQQLESQTEPLICQLLKKLQIAFDIFFLNGINDLYLRLPNGDKTRFEQIRFCLEILSHFDQAQISGSKITYHHKNQKIDISVVNPKDHKVDPNLTLLAAVNRLNDSAMTDICMSVGDYIQNHLLPSDPNGNFTIYNSIFLVKGIKDKLILPPLEVNNYKWRASQQSSQIEVDHEVKQSESDKIRFDRADNDILELTEKANFDNEEKVYNEKKSSMDVSSDQIEEKVIDDTNQDRVELTGKNDNLDNCAYIDSNSFIERLKEATDLLASLENTNKGEEILNGIIASLHECLEHVKADVIDDLTIEKEQVFIKQGSSTEIVEKFYSRITEMLSRFKNNSGHYKNNISSERKKIEFEKIDCEEVAAKLKLPSTEVKEILSMLENCFDTKGYFLRNEFEIQIPQFLSYGDSVFKFLWNYLNKPLHKNDRVAFLNSLHLLISKLSQPEKILSFLLDELYRYPLRVSYSDRNAFLLASLLLRNYNKEVSVDIELTPSEVLLIKDGLNEDVLQYAVLRIEAEKKLIKEKLDIIHDRLIKALALDEPRSISWDPHFLLSLEREAIIFLSLVKGNVPRQIVISALSEYGNPKSAIYNQNHEKTFMLLLLQHLKLLIKGLGRVGDIEDIGVLADLKKNEAEFTSIFTTFQHESNVKLVFETIDDAMGNITSLQ